MRAGGAQSALTNRANHKRERQCVCRSGLRTARPLTGRVLGHPRGVNTRAMLGVDLRVASVSPSEKHEEPRAG